MKICLVIPCGRTRHNEERSFMQFCECALKVDTVTKSCHNCSWDLQKTCIHVKAQRW